MEDLDDFESNDPPMISDFTAKIVLVVILWVMNIVTLITTLATGALQEFWDENPRGLIEIIILILGISLVISVIALVTGWFDSKKDKRKKEVSREGLRIQQMPLLVVPVNNKNGEYSSNICYICKERLVEEAGIVRCPQCSIFFHLEHIMDVIYPDGKCPNCDFSMEKRETTLTEENEPNNRPLEEVQRK